MLIIVPAWNEEATVAAVVTEIRAAVTEASLAADLLVVDDGSDDATASVALEAGALVARLPINLGVGGAMRTGYRYARRQGYAATVQVDADGQHNPADIPALLAGLAGLAGLGALAGLAGLGGSGGSGGSGAPDGADIVIGARVTGDGAYVARGPRRWAMRLLSITISRIAGTRLTDTTSGFKACGPRAIELFARSYPAEYLGDTVESLVVAARSHLRIREVAVVMRPRAGGQPSHSPLRATAFLGRAVLALTLALTRPRPELLHSGAHSRYEELGV